MAHAEAKSLNLTPVKDTCVGYTDITLFWLIGGFFIEDLSWKYVRHLHVSGWTSETRVTTFIGDYKA